ncbi:MAG: TatD family hydrolase [Prevotella sp.]|nr:TatD family hydrolase [Staphylococcus sp.]MCM1350210.1 TatD family hydrolase [Prevotella sp.]
MFIDTHVHLNSKQLESHLEEVIQDAFLVGVTQMIVVGYDLETSKKAIQLAHQYDWCYAAVGYHPTEIKNYTEYEYQALEEMLQDEKVIALGEIGYDLHWDTTTVEEQEIAFVKQIELAQKYHLPLIIHSRDAHQLTFDTLKKHHAETVGGILHSYSGSVELAREYVKMNFSLGISGPVTFKNGKNMKEVVEQIDIQYLVSETDAPYLTPHPYRGTENGPKYIPLIVEEMAKIKQISVEEMALAIKNNVNRIVGKSL